MAKLMGTSEGDWEGILDSSLEGIVDNTSERDCDLDGSLEGIVDSTSEGD